MLDEVADLLRTQEASSFRVRAYEAAAITLRSLDNDVAAILQSEGEEGLRALPGIGRAIASSVREYLHTGHLGMLDRLRGTASPEDLFATLPGVGPELAARIAHDLGVETLEDLEVAAHDGRLELVPGFGPRRVRAIRDSIAVRLDASTRRRARAWRMRHAETNRQADGHRHPTIDSILTIDKEYRRRAAQGTLKTIAPRRFNPDKVAWLPIMHSHAEGYSFTVLFSNTARAHALGKTHDWVVVHYERDGQEDQCTVVTEASGPLAGRRIVRGREPESIAFYGGAS